MKLGILVVYLFGARTAPLLDIHLSRIERYTRVPYTIYASANRLAPEFRERLTLHPRIRICDIPDTDLRGMLEHSYYLDHLARIAIEDGVTHAVTLHLDSFPIRQGWAEELAGRLSERCVLATIDSVNTACLFFHRDFYCRYHPNFLVTEEECTSPLYPKFLTAHCLVHHSGTGYAYRAYQHGLLWNYLPLTPTYGAAQIGDVFGGMIFHLVQGIWAGEYHSQLNYSLHQRAYERIVAATRRAYRFVVPDDLRRKFRLRFGRVLGLVVHRPFMTWHAQCIEQFLQNPEAYIAPIENRIMLSS